MRDRDSDNKSCITDGISQISDLQKKLGKLVWRNFSSFQSCVFAGAYFMRAFIRIKSESGPFLSRNMWRDKIPAFTVISLLFIVGIETHGSWLKLKRIIPHILYSCRAPMHFLLGRSFWLSVCFGFLLRTPEIKITFEITFALGMLDQLVSKSKDLRCAHDLLNGLAQC